MNQSLPQADNGPAIDPLSVMDAQAAPVAVVQMPQAVSNAQLPAVILTQITKPGSLIDVSQIPQGERDEIDRLAATVMLENQDSVTMYGYKMQKEYSDGLSGLLGQSTLGQTGLYEFIAEDLKLSTEIVQAAMEKFGKKGDNVGLLRKFARSLPVFGSHFTTAEVLLESRRRLTEIFENLEIKIAEKQRTLMEGEVTIDVMMSNIRTHLVLLRRHILAGEKVLLRMNDQYKSEALALPANPDPLKVADLVLKKNLIIGFEVRLLGLKNAYVKSATLLPQQFSTMKEATQIIMQNLRDTSVTTIPDLKVSVIQLVALNNLQEANAQSRSIRDQAARAAEQAQELLGQTVLTAKEQQGDGLDEAERLKRLLEKMTKLNEDVAKVEEATAGKRKKASDMLAESLNEFTIAQRRTAERFIQLEGAK